MSYHKEQEYRTIDYAAEKFTKGEYENCAFHNCNFTGVDLSNINFIECTFENCNFSLAKVINTGFREVTFTGCKLLGMRFEDCNDFLFFVNFSDCLLNLSSFFKKKLKNTSFKNCSMREVYFSNCDLSSALFQNCDLRGAVFDKTILEKADFRTAFNYSIAPDNNKIKKAKFSRDGVVGLLDRYNIEID